MGRYLNAQEDPWRVRESDFPVGGMPIDQLRFLLNYAILAPSSHNSQPWLFRLNGEEVGLLADRTRALPVSDPDDRELIISCGAALFNLRVAIRHFGYLPEVRTFPDLRDPDLLAFVRMGAQVDPDESIERLFGAIPARRTCRFPFEPETVDEDTRGVLERAAQEEGASLFLASDTPTKNALSDLIAEGDRIQGSDRSFRRELASWIHPNRSHSHDGIPGYGMGMGDISSIAGPLVVRTFDLGRGRAARDRELAEGSPLLAVLSTRMDNPASWLKAGQALQHVLLTAQDRGLSASFLNQPIECFDLREAVAQMTGGGAPQLILRIGAGRGVRPVPRRPVMEVLSKA